MMGMADLDHCTYSRCSEAPWGTGGYVSVPFGLGMANVVILTEGCDYGLGWIVKTERKNELRVENEKNI